MLGFDNGPVTAANSSWSYTPPGVVQLRGIDMHNNATIVIIIHPLSFTPTGHSGYSLVRRQAGGRPHQFRADAQLPAPSMPGGNTGS